MCVANCVCLIVCDAETKKYAISAWNGPQNDRITQIYLFVLKLRHPVCVGNNELKGQILSKKQLIYCLGVKETTCFDPPPYLLTRSLCHIHNVFAWWWYLNIRHTQTIFSLLELCKPDDVFWVGRNMSFI
jgi:hypothetical protein